MLGIILGVTNDAEFIRFQGGRPANWLRQQGGMKKETTRAESGQFKQRTRKTAKIWKIHVESTEFGGAMRNVLSAGRQPGKYATTLRSAHGCRARRPTLSTTGAVSDIISPTEGRGTLGGGRRQRG